VIARKLLLTVVLLAAAPAHATDLKTCIDVEVQGIIATHGGRMAAAKGTPRADAIRREVFLQWSATTKCGPLVAGMLATAANSDDPHVFQKLFQ
jgi:hypothetical protein